MKAERFWSRVDREPEGCWLWRGQTRANGYGKVHVQRDGKQVTTTAHRLAYELMVGPIPDGLEIDHLCRTPACVRPDHLEAVTHAENMRRGNPGRKRKGYAQEVGAGVWRVFIEIPRPAGEPRCRVTQTFRGTRSDVDALLALHHGGM